MARLITTKGVQKIDESSLSRVWKHANNGFAILTAFRDEYDDEENKKRNRKLQKEIRSRGYGYFKLDGHWVENIDDDDKENVDVAEESFFIPIGDKDTETFEQDIMDFIHWDSELPQDAAVIKTPDDDEVHLLWKNGDKDPIGNFKPDSVAQAYSKMKGGRTFVFEKIQIPHNNMAKMAYKAIGQMW